jgi:hypothetical protein
MKITIFGCCRQDSLNCYDITSIKHEIAYCHYTKEMLEIINYCKYGHITPEESIYVLRHPLVSKTPLLYNEKFKYDLENSAIFILDITSKMSYEYNNKFCHHSIYTENESFNISDEIKNSVVVKSQSYDEIYEDILKLKRELYNKPIIIVTHIVTENKGSRYELSLILQDICNKENITIIHPVNELISRGYDINHLIEADTRHYTKAGHDAMKIIYDDFIRRVIPDFYTDEHLHP